MPLFPDQLLIDDLIGHRVALNPGQHTELGRAAPFVVGDDDDFMHRIFLQFWDRQGTWMVTNRGSRLTARIVQRVQGSHSQMDLSPGATLPLPLGHSSVVFSTPEMNYELALTVAQTLTGPADGIGGPPAGRPTTGAFNPNDEQILLLKALAAPLLKAPGAEDSVIPTVKALARELGWTEKKVNTKIAYLCTVLEKNGFGSFSSRDGLATPRRIPLAHFAVAHYDNL